MDKDKCFNHREYCIKVEKTSLFGRVYLFDFPNGYIVEVSRDMTTLLEWFGFWAVYIEPKGEGVKAMNNLGHKYPKEVEKLLNWVKEDLPPDC